MFFTSSYINQSIGGQNALFAQNDYRAQQMSIPMGGGGMGSAGMGPPPPPMNMPPPPSMVQSALNQGGRGGGMAGERLAGGMMSAAGGVGSLASGGFAAMSALGSFGMGGGLGAAASAVDPMMMAGRAGMAGYGAAGGGAMGMAGGMAAAGAVALPMYGAYKAAQAYGGAFTGGMRDQVGLNQTLRQNFQHQGGSRGQGFSQQQMGNIGGVVQQELNRNAFTSPGELNSLIGGGQQAGMFQGVRGVSEFTKKFRTMLDTLKSVQKELGGSLTEALNFVNESRQAGVFQQMDRAQFATQVRNTSQMTGMNRQETMQMAIQGASIARETGGYGRQGAQGAMRTAATLGTALNVGAVSEEQLSDATGGLTGTAALQSFTSNMMQRTGRFLRRPGMGRFSLYAMANQSGNIDPAMMRRMAAGDISVGQVSRRAHRNVRSMGRAQALNRAGELRGQVMEQGGMAGQIGMMRLMMGDRVMNSGDSTSQLVMQRRFGMSRQEATVMQGLMRNQGRIAQQEASDRSGSARGARRERLVAEERSMDAVGARISHALAEGMGLNAVRSSGRRFVTKISSGIERMMDQMLGIYQGEMSQGTQTAVTRAGMGTMTQTDRQQMRMLAAAEQQMGLQDDRDPFATSFGQALSGGDNLGTRLEGMGFDIRGGGAGRAQQVRRAERAINQSRLARSGVVSAETRPELAALMADTEGTNAQMVQARVMARGGSGGESAMLGVLESQGMSNTAAMAYMARTGGAMPAGSDVDQSMMQSRRGTITAGMVGRDALRGVAMLASPAIAMGSLLAGGGGMMPDWMRSETMDAAGITGPRTSRENAISFMGQGGHRGNALRRRGSSQLVRATNVRDLGRPASRRLRAQGLATLQESRGLELSEDQIEAVADDDRFRRLVLTMSTGGPQARGALAELDSMANTDPDEERRNTLSVMASAARDEMDDPANNGQIGSTLRRVIETDNMQGEVDASKAQMREMSQGFIAAGGQLRASVPGAGDQVDSSGHSLTQGLGTSIARIGASLAGGRAEEANDRMRSLSVALSEMTPAQRAERMGEMSQVTGEHGTAAMGQIMAGAAQRTQVRDSLMGVGRGGRRSRRARMEAGLHQAGGFGLGDEFSFRTGEGDDERVVGGARAQRALQDVFTSGVIEQNDEGRTTGISYARGRRGQNQRAALAAYRQQLEGGGFNQDQREEIMSAMAQQGAAQGGTEAERRAAQIRISGGTVTDEEGNETYQEGLRERYSTQFEALDKRQSEARDAARAAADPLGAHRNTALDSILTELRARLPVSTTPNPEDPVE